jgi:hypothetical protein
MGDRLVGLSATGTDGRISFLNFVEVFGKGDVTGTELDEEYSQTAGQTVDCG